ncbi:MAG: hypothetical protein IPO81_00375 [Kouleothrix sp.]|nr:hypothetical protein [Kouleothrix sp.]
MLTTPPAPTAERARRAGRFAPTLDHVWLAVALALLALRPLLTPIPPNDFWWHLATGRAIVAQGQIPVVDSFSYTRFGQPFFNQGWLAQLFMYGLHQLGGVPLIIITQALVIALAYWLLLRLCIRRSGSVRLSVALLLLATVPLSFSNWIVRPQSYALPIFAGFLTILTEYRLGMSRRLWLLPPLMALWVNLHGTFVLGLALIGLTVAGEAIKLLRSQVSKDHRPKTIDQDSKTIGNTNVGPWPLALGPPPPALRPLLIWGLIAAAATLLNPRGLEVVGYVRNLLGSSAVTSLVTEWAPPTVRDLDGQIFFLFAIGCGALMVYGRRRPDLTDALLFGAFFWLALGATRNVVWFGMVATPLLIGQAATLVAPRPRRPGSPALNALVIGMLALLLAIGLPWVKPALLPPSVGALLSEDTPVAAVDFLRAQPDRPRHLFHSEAAGSYLIWAAPEQPVFVDTRIELYPFDQWRDYINLGQANNVDELLRKYDIDGLLLSAAHQRPLVDAIGRDRGWVERYRDEQTVYFTRVAR